MKRLTVRFLITLLCVIVITHLFGGCVSPYLSPSNVLKTDDLVGLWQIDYGCGREQLTLRKDGTFLQDYQAKCQNERSFRFESDKKWWIETPSPGFIRLWLPGARYLALGSQWQGATCCTDHFTGEHLFLEDELVLHVRMDASNRLLLHHLSIDADGGFPLFSDGLVYRKIEGLQWQLGQ